METSILAKLASCIECRSLHIVVLGSSYVGLPTAALFADTGFHVTAVDVKAEIVKAVNSGLSPVNEPGLKELIFHNVEAGRLNASLKASEMNQADAILISVQTPIYKNKKPNLSYLEKALENVGNAIKKGMLIIISSTAPPDTMLNMVKPKLESLSGLKADTDFYLAYVPERIAPGNALKEFVENPRLVGGIGPNSTKIAAELFRTVCKTVIETDATTAEVAKLAENTFRDVNIAFANELALICEQHGADVKEVIRLANTHPRVNIHIPGPGVGGPCLTKDPYLLIHHSEQGHELIKTARKINDHMPGHIVKLTIKALDHVGKTLQESTITVLGTAYKANVGDPRESPSKQIIKGFIKLGARVRACDPYCKETFGADKSVSLQESLRGSDCMIIVTDHIELKNINLKEAKNLMANKPVIIDGRRVVNPIEAERLGFIYHGIGLGKPRS